MSRTRYEWTLLDFAAWSVGAVPVPVYETSSAEQVHWILSDAGVRLAVVETAAHAAEVATVRDRLPGLEDVLVVEDGAVDALRAAGADVPAAEVERRRAAQRVDDLATVIYTSGSTGRPKGVELTHRNFVHLALNGRAGLAEILDADGARTLLFLPLAHVFARFIQVVVVASNAVLAHSWDTKNLVADLGSFHPTFLLAVPRVFEKVYNTAEQKTGTGAKRKIFHWAAKVAITWSRSLDAPGGPGSGCASSTPSRTGSSTRRCVPRWAGGSRTRSPAERRSASGSATSTAASACASSRATASPRPRRPRP